MIVTPTEQRFFRFLTSCAYHSLSKTLYLPYDVLPPDTLTQIHFRENPDEDKSIWQAPSGLRAEFSGNAPNGWDASTVPIADRRAAFEQRLDVIKSYISAGALSIKEGSYLIENLLHEYDPDSSDEAVSFATRAEISKIPPYLPEQHAHIQPMGTSPLEAAYEQQRQKTIQKIAAMMGVPTELIEQNMQHVEEAYSTPAQHDYKKKPFLVDGNIYPTHAAVEITTPHGKTAAAIYAEEQLASYSHTEQTAYVPNVGYVRTLGAVQAAAEFQSALLQLQALTGYNTDRLSARYYPYLQTMIEMCASGFSVEAAQEYIDTYQGRGGHAMQLALAKTQEEKARKSLEHSLQQLYAAPLPTKYEKYRELIVFLCKRGKSLEQALRFIDDSYQEGKHVTAVDFAASEEDDTITTTWIEP